MVYNTKYQQKAYIIIMCIKINVIILCHFLWNDLTNNILLKMCYIFYKASMQLISLAGSEVRVPLRESIWILANDFGENPQNPFKDSVKINCENPF